MYMEKLFVCYAHNQGVGNSFLEVDFDIDCQETLREIEKYIIEKSNFDEVVLVNWKVIEKEADKDE